MIVEYRVPLARIEGSRGTADAGDVEIARRVEELRAALAAEDLEYARGRCLEEYELALRRCTRGASHLGQLA